MVVIDLPAAGSYQFEITHKGTLVSGPQDFALILSGVTVTPACPAGEMEDCNGNCAPIAWLGDGNCDDGTQLYNGNLIDFNCGLLGDDGGDCGGGPSIVFRHASNGKNQLWFMEGAVKRVESGYLPTRGKLALEMMFTTATVQANFDYESEADMVDKMRTAAAVSPIVSAIFANSSLSEGKANGFVSKRMHIWHHTDPDRCGLLPMIFEEDFGYRRYVEWALDVPMFFVARDGEYRPAGGTSFRQFLEQGFGSARATREDFNTHLTTLFPDVRLKQIIEVRGADAVPPGLTCSLPALWKGVLYDDEARAAAAALVDRATFQEREAARADVAQRGLAGSYAGQPVKPLADALVKVARDGLRRIGHAGRRDADETSFLDPVLSQLEQGVSPGRSVALRWEGEWGRSVDRLIEYARY